MRYKWLIEHIENNTEYNQVVDHENRFVANGHKFSKNVAFKLTERLNELNIVNHLVTTEDFRFRIRNIDILNNEDMSTVFLSIVNNDNSDKSFQVIASNTNERSKMVAENFYGFVKNINPNKSELVLKDNSSTILEDVIECDCPVVIGKFYNIDDYDEASLMNTEKGEDIIVDVFLRSIKDIESVGLF